MERKKGPRMIGGDDLAQAIMRDAAAEAVKWLHRSYDFGCTMCESPIERIWLAQILHPTWAHDYSFSEHPLNVTVVQPMYEKLAERGASATPPCDGFWIFPQYRLGAHRVDFLLWARMLASDDIDRQLIIECDGHEFHEKTKEQVQRDKARERAIVERGIPVMRFAGSEIYADSASCVGQALNFLFEVR